MSPRAVLVPATLLLGLAVSVASSIPARDFMNQSFERGPTLQLQPGEVAVFNLHFRAPRPVPSPNNLLIEVLERPATVLDSGAGDTADTADTSDTGTADTASSDTADTGTPGEGSNVHFRIHAGDWVYEDAELVANDFRGVSMLRWIGLLDECDYVSSMVEPGLNPWTVNDQGECEGTIQVEMWVEEAATIHWGARLQGADSWQPCNSDGEPAGCLEEEPDPTVILEILPA